MPGVIERKIPWLIQPQYPVGIDRSNPLSAGLTEVYVPLSVTNRTLIRGYNPTVAAGVITREVGALGLNIALSSATDNLGLIIAGDGDDIFPSATDATVFVIRRSKDTTARATTLFGYDGTGTGPDRVLAHAPFSDGNIYWDFGSADATNRISAPYTKSTGIDYLVFIAGGGKGREIWRNGTKIAGDTAKTGSRAATAANFRIGAVQVAAARADDEDVYLFGTANRAWSDTEIKSWFARPWQIFQPIPRKIHVASAGVILASTTKAGAWSVRNLAAQTHASAFSVRNLVGTTQASAWSVRNLASQTQAGAFSVRNAVATTQAGAWTIRNLAATTQAGAWSVAATGIASAVQAGSWSIRNLVSTSQAGAFSVRNLSAQTQAGAWSVRSSVSTTKAGGWTVYNSATSTQAGAWKVWGYAAGAQAGSWSVGGSTITITMPAPRTEYRNTQTATRSNTQTARRPRA